MDAHHALQFRVGKVPRNKIGIFRQAQEAIFRRNPLCSFEGQYTAQASLAHNFGLYLQCTWNGKRPF